MLLLSKRFYNTLLAFFLLISVSNSICKNALTSLRSLCPPFTGPVAEFCNANIRGQLCVGGNLTVGGTIFGAQEGFGNTLLVEKTGNDTTGARNGAPFLTIQAALNAALPGDLVWVFPGTYDEIITIPAGVILSAASTGTVIIQQLNVTQPTDLVTMGEASFIRDILLLLTSTQHVQLRGIVHSGASIPSTSIVIDTISIFIDNSAAGPGSSDVYGIFMTGTGSVGFIGDFILNGIIQVATTGTGKKRGIYIESPTLLEIITPLVFMIGGSDSIAFETNHPGVVAAVQAGAFSGDFVTQTPDISQTQGSLQLDVTYLGNSNANGLGFTTLTQPNTFIWGNTSVIGGGQTFYLRPGTAELADDPVLVTASQKFLAKGITVHALVPPGLGESTTITVQRKTPSDISPVDTILTVTLVDDETKKINDSISVHFDKGDEMSVKVETSAGAATSAVSVVVDLY